MQRQVRSAPLEIAIECNFSFIHLRTQLPLMHALGAAIGFGTANKIDSLLRFHDCIFLQNLLRSSDGIGKF